MKQTMMFALLIVGSMVSFSLGDFVDNFDSNIDNWEYSSGPGNVSWQDTYYIDSTAISTGCMRIDAGGVSGGVRTYVASKQAYNIYQSASVGGDARFQAEMAANGGGYYILPGLMFKWDDDNYFGARYSPKIGSLPGDGGAVTFFGRVNGVVHVETIEYSSEAWFRENMQAWIQFNADGSLTYGAQDVAGLHSDSNTWAAGYDFQTLGEGTLYLFIDESKEGDYGYFGNFDNVIVTGVSPVPEPVTSVLVVLGLGVVSTLRRRFHRAV